jgi:hypothetical protein
MGLLKDSIELGVDAWRNISKRWLLSLFQSTLAGARGWTVAEWRSPDEAMSEFGEADLLRCLNEALDRADEARAERDKLAARKSDLDKLQQEDRVRFRAFNQQYEAATSEANSCNSLLKGGLQGQLVRGELVARGFREPFTYDTPYLTISRHQWRIISIPDDWSDRAEGAGVAYNGLAIGKPGTKGIFRRGSVNRQEQQQAVVIEQKSVPSIRGVHCGWRGCTESFDGFFAPPGWVNLNVYCSPEPILDIRQITDWRHDKVLCPAHAKALDNLLYPGAGVLQHKVPHRQSQGSPRPL